MLGAIVAVELQREARMRSSRVAFALTFPFGTDPEAVTRALVALSGLTTAVEVIAEVRSCQETITHRLYLPETAAQATAAQLRAAIPGLRIEPAEPKPVATKPALMLAVAVPARAVLREVDPIGASRSLLAALLPLGHNEEIVVRWALRPGHPQPDAEADRAWQSKASSPGLLTAGMVLVRAGSRPRARALAARVVAVLRTRRGPAGGLEIHRTYGDELPRASRSGWLSVAELAGVIGWPIGSDDAITGVRLGAAREIAPTSEMGRRGRPVLIARHHGQPRPVTLSAEAARHHMAVLGPTGSGKSALMGRAILADIEAGYGGVVVDPRGDLVRDLIERIPSQHADRVVVIDPTDSGPVPGVDLLGAGDPDLRADVLLTVFRSIFRDAWGPRTDSYMRLGLRTLAELPGASLSDWPALFMDAGTRRRAVGRLSDPLLVGQWQAFEALSQAERAQHIAAPMSRVLSLIGRPAVRAVIAQPAPKLDVARLLDRRRWLVVSLSEGALGAPAARLLGATVTYVVWSAIAARAAIAPEKRHPVFIYFDELQALADMPMGLESLFEQARGLGAGVTIGTQNVARLAEPVRHALLTNVATLVSFRAGADEATRIARELPGLDARDLISLAAFEVAARVGMGRGAASAVVTGHTEPWPDVTGQAGRVRTLSAARYGRSREEIEAAIAQRYGAAAVPEPIEQFGRGRRQA
jgi:hypothetical protein